MPPTALSESVETYATGKTWYWYVPLWLFGAYVFYELFQFDMVRSQMPLVLLVPYSFDFVMHELAHLVAAFMPAVLTASAGSGSELLLGIGLVVAALWQRSYFAVLFCALWFALACQSAGQYMADAARQQLPLVSLGAALSGGEAKHDWHFVFGQLGLLPESEFIGNLLRGIGMLVAFAALVFTAWVIYRMSRAPRWAATEQLASDAVPGLRLDSGNVFTPPKRASTRDDDAPPPGATDSFS
jgi:hypothetical protein